MLVITLINFILSNPEVRGYRWNFLSHSLHIIYIASGVFLAGWIEVWCWILTGERQTAVIRSKYVQVLLNQDMSFFDTYGNNGDIVSQVLSDVLLIQSALSEKVGNYVHNMGTCFSGLVIGFINCWQIALITLATGPFIVAAGGISNIFLHKLAENIQDAYAEAANMAEQAMSYIRTLCAFTNETLAKYSYATSLQATLRYVTHRKAHGGEIIAALFAIILSACKLLPLASGVAATNFYSFDQGRIAAYRLYEMISRSTSTINQDGNTLVSVQGNIEFRNVYFSYLSRPEIPILREVLLDGQNIKSLKLEWLRSQIGLVTQEPALLSLSIRDNITYGRSNATFDQIEEAAKIAHAHAFISSLEKGYETQVGRIGLALTEEQKIKISVARAVLSNPSILLLDEVTGGLDFEAESAVQEALDILMLGRSTIIIARQLSLIRNADYIAVMEEGQLVEMGTHDELLSLDGLYTELLRCEEATKPPKRTPIRTHKETTTSQVEKDSPENNSFEESSSPKMVKSPSLQRVHGSHAIRPTDETYNFQESPKTQSTPPDQILEHGLSLDAVEQEPSIKREDSFGKRLPELPKIDVTSISQQASNDSDPESPISPLLSTCDPKKERSHSKSFSQPIGQLSDVAMKQREVNDKQCQKPPPFWRLVELSLAEWLYAVLGSIGAAVFGSFIPLLAYVLALIVTAYYRPEEHNHLQNEVNKWCLILSCMGVVTVVANFLQHFYFGIMGEKMTERVRRMMFSAMLRNEVGWFDEEENSVDTLSMRLANDATFVRAAFSNRLSVFIQDSAAVVAAVIVGMLLEWRLAFVALGTLPILIVSAIAQKLWLAGFSRGIQEMHRKASMVLEDAVRNIYTVVAYCAGNKVMELYRLQLKKIYKQSFLQGMVIGFAFGLSQYLLLPVMLFFFGILLTPLKMAMLVFQQHSRIFEIIDRVPKIDPDDNSALKPPNVYGSIELKNVDFCYPTHPKSMVLNNFSLKINGGQTVAIVGVSGSGKSTIISLIERFYDPVSGQILLDGRDLKLFNLRWLRNHLGLVQQEPVVFSTTIRENIIYARHNVDLTPGQKQRISIARVVLKNAPILLLDEASSAIESESSRVVQEALDTLIMGNKTTILIAHTAAMMRHVDNIVVLNGGRIVEQGTHDSLVARNGLYVQLMQPHFAKGLRQHRLV
ncbi:ABC transporter B family member 20 [Vitis vinifera]|uniref:ABC transporter B family member 20 n=1 Tax=Vitis vinifera TaxID=29760 RepID=A0A438FAI9_VITVI|nr:ABC transporter B family member 20 [Vitis vinifera]